MKAKALSAAIAAPVFVFFGSQALAIPVTLPNLGAAGGFTVLDIGSNGNVSASASSITGNVGVNGGNFSDSGTPITGNLVTSSTGNVSLAAQPCRAQPVRIPHRFPQLSARPILHPLLLLAVLLEGALA
jgi:hypothetical protein